MTWLWRKAGKVLRDARGRLLACPACPCETGTGTGTGTGACCEAAHTLYAAFDAPGSDCYHCLVVPLRVVDGSATRHTGSSCVDGCCDGDLPGRLLLRVDRVYQADPLGDPVCDCYWPGREFALDHCGSYQAGAWLSQIWCGDYEACSSGDARVGFDVYCRYVGGVDPDVRTAMQLVPACLEPGVGGGYPPHSYWPDGYTAADFETPCAGVLATYTGVQPVSGGVSTACTACTNTRLDLTLFAADPPDDERATGTLTGTAATPCPCLDLIFDCDAGATHESDYTLQVDGVEYEAVTRDCAGQAWTYSVLLPDGVTATVTVSRSDDTPCVTGTGTGVAPCSVLNTCCPDLDPGGCYLLGEFTLFNSSGDLDCPWTDGVTFDLTSLGTVVAGLDSTWSGTVYEIPTGTGTAFEVLLFITLTCDEPAGTWKLTLTCTDGSLARTVNASSVTCDPLSLLFEFNASDIPACCVSTDAADGVAVEVTKRP